jgi:hypothetical protein
METRLNGMLKLPRAMRRDLVILIVAKLALLSVLYCLFFSPAHRPAIDAVAHIAGSEAEP